MINRFVRISKHCTFPKRTIAFRNENPLKKTNTASTSRIWHIFHDIWLILEVSYPTARIKSTNNGQRVFFSLAIWHCCVTKNNTHSRKHTTRYWSELRMPVPGFVAKALLAVGFNGNYYIRKLRASCTKVLLFVAHSMRNGLFRIWRYFARSDEIVWPPSAVTLTFVQQLQGHKPGNSCVADVEIGRVNRWIVVSISIW